MKIQSILKSKKGFTIIEVVLVLAIAGLILLMVFIALPGLQRSQADTRRKEDMGRLATAFTNYQGNNNGNMPEQDKSVDFIKTYIGADFKDPDGEPYVISYRKYADVGEKTNVAGAWPDSEGLDEGHHVHVITHAKCSSVENQVESGSGNRSYAIIYRLEGGGVYCESS